MDRIVVGVDGSDGSKEALRWALSEARLRGAALRIVYAWKMPLNVANGFAPVAIPDSTTMHELARQRLDKTVDEVVGHAKDVQVERRSVEGMAARVLVAAAAGADLLVVGSRGHGGFVGLLLDSVGQQCASHAACPVVIVRAAQA